MRADTGTLHLERKNNEAQLIYRLLPDMPYMASHHAHL